MSHIVFYNRLVAGLLFAFLYQTGILVCNKQEILMLEEIGSYDAKTKLPEILRRVAQGEAFTITNRGKPIADLIPSRMSDQHKREAAINNLLTTKKHIVSDKMLAELKESGRK